MVAALALLALAPNVVAGVADEPGLADNPSLADELWQAFQGDSQQAASCGAYIDFHPAGRVDAGKIAVSASRLQSRADAGTVASGGVVVRQRIKAREAGGEGEGERQLAAPAMRIDESAGLATSEGPLRLREPGLHLLGRRAEVELDGGRALLQDAEFVLPLLGWRGRAERIERAGGALGVAQASFTRCPPADSGWLLRAQSVEFDESKAFAIARHARLRLGPVPVFYAPYLRFPVRSERMSGFLFPAVGDDDGLDLSIPYYFNLAPNLDATVTARYMARRGTGLEGEFRRRGRSSRTEISAAWLGADDDYDGQLSRREFLAAGGVESAFAPAERWLLDVDHRGRLFGARTLVDFAAVSDNDYFADLGSRIGAFSRVQLERRAEIEYARGGLAMRLWGQSFQRLEPGREPYRRLPELQVAYAGRLAGPLAWSLGGAWSSFARGGGEGGERLHVEPRLRLPFSKPWGFLALTAGLRHTAYDAHSVQTERDIHLAVADSGLFFERTARRGAWLQTLEPRLQYRYQSYARQDHLPRFDTAPKTFSFRRLFHDNRFAGVDRIGDANQFALGLTTRLLQAASGRELLAASIGGIAHLRDRRVVLGGQPSADEVQNTSAIAGELRGALGPLRVATVLAWDGNDNALDEAYFGASYRRDARRIVNIGLRRRKDNATRQTDFALHWPLAGRWTVFGRWNYDWRLGQAIETFAGFGYASCCLAAKLLWHRTLDVGHNAPRDLPSSRLATDQGVLLQLELRGLAGLGGGVDARLARGIKGYRRAE